MVRVKICGITSPEDARLAAECGASAIGFVFYPPSPRFVTPAQAAAIRRALPPWVATVGVFVNEDPARIEEVRRLVGLDYVQLHGDEPPETARLFFPRVIKALRVRNEEDLSRISAYRHCAAAVLLDTYVKGLPGGTGRTFDWSLAKKAKEYGLPIILAGGLRPENVCAAVRQVRPYALDVSSGVEVFPGKKHPVLLRRLFANLSRMD
ncbi:MAG: phosphoribosylanthranilate isomerase [Thermodesulfobacteria bacterium]|nr:phosphoribosylanthranilate isomerase [Thermodesulfobacteriota bacterium]